MYFYDIDTKTVKTKTWAHLPVCTSAFRWLENYYCFHGHNFTKFHPVTGEVSGDYPKDARNYFMRCPNFGEFIIVSESYNRLILYEKYKQIPSIYLQIRV